MELNYIITILLVCVGPGPGACGCCGSVHMSGALIHLVSEVRSGCGWSALVGVHTKAREEVNRYIYIYIFIVLIYSLC